MKSFGTGVIITVISFNEYFVVNPIQTRANGTHSHYDPSLHNHVLDVKYKF